MDGLTSIFLATGAFTAALAGLGFWTWRRSARGGTSAMSDARSGAPPLRRAASGLTVEETAAAELVRGATDFQDAGIRCPKDHPPDGSATTGTFPHEASVLVCPPKVAPPASHQAAKGDLQQGQTAELSESDAPVVPTSQPLAQGNAPPDEEAADRPSNGGSTSQEAEGVGPARGEAANSPDAAHAKLPISTARPETGEPSDPPAACGSLAEEAGHPAETLEAHQPTAVIEESPTDLAASADLRNLAQPADLVATEAMPLLPAEPQNLGDSGAGGEIEPTVGPEWQEEPEVAASGLDGKHGSGAPEPAPTEITSPADQSAPEKPQGYRLSQPAVHRDRRGNRRTAAPANVPPAVHPDMPGPTARPPAEAKLRLSLHPIRRTARLSVVLARPDGSPQRVTFHIDGRPPIEAYNTQRYDDLDLPWTGQLLEGELRIASAEGFQWLRSARQVHIFAEDPSEPDLISVGAARPGVEHTLICRSGDAAAVCAAAASMGSPEPTDQEHWQGVPDGWTVLSGYTPVRTAGHLLAAGLRPLDPGAGIEIGFEGGMAVRLRVFAEGHPPRIAISPEPVGASVTIGGQPAALAAGGGWEAPGWDVPGHHLVDVVPGPSATYEIAADPSSGAGWEFWNAHAGRFGDRAAGPWARAEICGASIRGPAGQAVLAVEAQPTLIALGARSGAVPLSRRADVSVSVGFVPEPPAFLLSATGQRRSQGRLIWLGLTPPALSSRRSDPDWAAAVRATASRRLPLKGADALGEDAWRKAKARARRLRRPRG